ncbi:hypothetical protein [Flavobacterium sp.]|jgi:hypothetical protein|uniref:hypothetical protein n=1 Tax=Flavobacterium sp. TaxID=239 RepID=UPI002603D3D6|nr:hypothetical protein [Flavobacterium sp.]
MINNNVIWVNTSSLIFNPLWVDKTINNSWEYSCLMTEVSVYGIQLPIEVSVDNVVINGNKRLKIAIDLKMEKVPIILYQDDKLNDLITSSFKPSDLVKILEVFDSKYGLKYSTRYNKKKLPKVIISLRLFLIGSNERISQIYQLKEYSKQVRKSYSFETNEIWDQLDSFNISLDEGIERMKDLFERKTTINFSLENKMVA